MNLSFLANYIEDSSYLKQLINHIVGKDKNNKINIIDAAKPILIYALYQKIKKPVLVISSSIESANTLFLETYNYFPELKSFHYFPDSFYGKANLEKDLENRYSRLQILTYLYQYQHGTDTGKTCPLVITSSSAAAERIIRISEFDKAIQKISVGMHTTPIHILHEWLELGYEVQNLVEIPGIVSHRGGIVDIFPLNSINPVRIEFDGNMINSIREFDPKTQRSMKLLDSVIISSANDGYDNTGYDTILNYFLRDSLIVVDSLAENLNEIQHKNDRLTSGNQLSDSDLSNDENYIGKDELQTQINRFEYKLYIDDWGIGQDNKSFREPQIFLDSIRYGGRLERFTKDLREGLKAGYSIFIVSQQSERLYEILQQQNIPVNQISGAESLLPSQSVSLIKGSIISGWRFSDCLILLSDNEIFGWIKQQRLSKHRFVSHHIYKDELEIGDYVVHVDHGIAKFIGLTKLNNNGTGNEYLVLEYAAGDKLYVPVDQIERIGRYIGGKDQLPILSRLNTQEWSETKARIKKSIQDLADELLKIYAIRETISGFAFSPDTLWQQELESSFPYLETPDQLEAIKDVKSDMEKARPMDRLVCGDVGYGKTEVALRSAFKAVMDNKQVAVLVPTTLLAQQHFLTFYNRLQAFPVRLVVLSRFCSEKEVREILDGLRQGNIDICIGTHRLLQKDVKFKDLGLLVIDEEQRFGVVHKEYFKKMRSEIDVLTLSATPIPRTLNMSLANIKDLSILETPPEDRLPIKTLVGPLNLDIVRKAVLYEMKRGGQIFYVNNRIHNIHLVAEKLHKLVPEARISVAHGQMSEEDLEKVMSIFINHQSDILLTTTIIESGIDIPRVNTLIVNDSDKLGLTQLYQLRGRVGRGKNNAFAYLFFNRGDRLTDKAKKRLQTIEEATELGSGFAIAMKDLEIRGAGNILGNEQSGYMAAVGYDLYCRLLADTIEQLRSRHDTKPHNEYKQNNSDISIMLPLVANIPNKYIIDEQIRISLYRRLATAISILELENVEEEINDRFGTIPKELVNLFYVARIKIIARIVQLEAIVMRKGQIVLTFMTRKNLDDSEILNKINGKYPGMISIGTLQVKLNFTNNGNGWQEILITILKVLAKID